jgi:hypothetical protein
MQERSDRKWFILIGGLYFILALFVSVHIYMLKVEPGVNGYPPVTKFNNYIIFANAHHHLLQGKNLYEPHPLDHWDLFKYSPSFATFAGLFAWLPDWLGLALWNLLNALVFAGALWMLPGFNLKARILVMLLVAVEAVTSLQNSQSNLLVAGLILWGWIFFEKGNTRIGTLMIVLTFFIKIFGIAALLLALFYPGKRKALAWAASWFMIILLIPLPLSGFTGLFTSYQQYLKMLLHDQSISVGISFMGIIQSWTGIEVPRTLTSLVGLALTCLLFLWRSAGNSVMFRARFLAALLLWMVLFNHRAESPTYIIAVTGVMLWFFASPRGLLHITLLVMVMVFTSLGATDLFPSTIRENFLVPYNIKALPCLMVWVNLIIGTGRIMTRNRDA